MSPHTPCQPATLPRRLGAMLYDSLLVFAVLFAATLPFALLAASGEQSVDNETVVHELDTVATGLAYQFYLLMVIAAFFCWFWLKNGQTLGMQAWRLTLRSTRGKPLSLGQCLLRLLGALVSAGCFGAGYWWVLFDPDRQSWHDRWSGTEVIYQPKGAGSTRAAQQPQTDSKT